MRKRLADLSSNKRFTPYEEKRELIDTGFVSVTKSLMEMSNKQLLSCPRCKMPLDLMNGVEWHGPLDIECVKCGSLFHIRTLIRAVKEYAFR